MRGRGVQGTVLYCCIHLFSVFVLACRRGRAAVLSRMLARPKLYLSEWAHAEGMESRARDNMASELDRLKGLLDDDGVIALK